MLRLSSSECVLKREVEEGRDALDKLAALNAALAEDKRDLNGQLQEVMLRGSKGATRRPEERSCHPFRPLCVCVCLQMECELSDGQSVLHTLRSEVSSLQKEVKTLSVDCSRLRSAWVPDPNQHRQMRHRGDV